RRRARRLVPRLVRADVAAGRGPLPELGGPDRGDRLPRPGRGAAARQLLRPVLALQPAPGAGRLPRPPLPGEPAGRPGPPRGPAEAAAGPRPRPPRPRPRRTLPRHAGAPGMNR